MVPTDISVALLIIFLSWEASVIRPENQTENPTNEREVHAEAECGLIFAWQEHLGKRRFYQRVARQEARRKG